MALSLFETIHPSNIDSETTSPVSPDHFSEMLQNATIGKAERSEFSNTARDTIKVTVNNYNFPKEGENHESPDVVELLRNALPPFLVEVCKRNQTQFTVGEIGGVDGSDSPVSPAVTTLEGDPVDVIDIMASEPSSFLVASVADRYTRSMLKCLAGYALYEPRPLSELSMEYLRHGVNVGDVGFVRGDGVFDFLFNVCPAKNGLINPSILPDGFSLESTEYSAMRAPSALPRKTRFFQSPITRTKSGECICEGSEGGILELPEGAIQEEAMNMRPFAKLAARCGVQWYEYTMTRGREISNGSLYLITSFTKCAQWGIAIFDRKCARGEGLRFDKKISLPFDKSTTKYHWKGSHTFPNKVANLNQGDSPNQCVFLRGYKIMLRQDIFDELCNDQHCGTESAMHSLSSRAGSISLTRDRATRIRGGGGADPMSKRLTNRGLLSWTKISSMAKSDEVTLHANFNSSLVHPSDLINAALLNQNPGAKVALTHDNVWIDLLQDNFPKFNCAMLINIAQSHTNNVDEYDCVSLEKISDSNNILHEGNHSLEGTEISTRQGPLPRELLERIFLLLDTNSMLTCRLINRESNEVIRSSKSLYFLACKAAGIIDNRQSPLSYAERLNALLKREDAWRKLEHMFKMTIKVDRKISLHAVAGGAYFLSDKNQKDLQYCHLPSSPEDNPQWISFPIHGPEQGWHGIFLGFAVSVYEHDLVINFISSDTGNQEGLQGHSLYMVLLRFSTGEYHPLARHPRIHVHRSPSIRPWIASRIVGDNLALVVRNRDGAFLFIFDWKTGYKRLQHEATKYSYSDPIFVTPELLLVPNLILSHFEIWHLPSFHPHLHPEPPVQILSLKIPAVSPEYSTYTFKCGGDHSPFLHPMQNFSPRPFLSSTESSIIIIIIRMASRATLSRRQHVSYTLIMDRRALLDTIQRSTSPSRQEHLSMWLTNEIIVHRIVDPDVRLGVQSRLVSVVPHQGPPLQSPASRIFATSQTSPTPHISTDSFSSSIPLGSSTTSSTSHYNFPRVEWADWGPPISRWLAVHETQAGCFSFAGQRYAFTVPGPVTGGKSKVVGADFNPHNLRRNEKMAQVRGEDGNNGAHNDSEEGKEEEALEMLDHGGVFLEEVYMGLKCVFYRTPDNHNFEAMMLDEERLLGLKIDLFGTIRKVKVLYIG